jgi:hypothetical protein
MKNTFFLALFLLTLTIQSYGADYYIDSIYNAEEIGRGGVEGFSTNSQGLWSNPASLRHIDKVSIGWYSATFMDDDVDYNNYTSAFKLGSFRLGVGYYDVRSDDIELNSLDEFGEAQTDSYYTYSNSILKVALQHPISTWGSIGTAVSKYNYSGYTLTGEGYGLDIGTVVSLPMEKIDMFHFSATFKNALSKQVAYSNDKTEDIPASIFLSGKADISDRLNIYLQRTINFNKAQLSGCGVSYYPWKTDVVALSLSLGASNYLQIRDPQKTRTSYSAGLGLKLAQLEFHFAYQHDPNADSEKQYFYTTVINI